MDLDLEERFVSSFIRPNDRANMRRWLNNEREGRARVRDKLPRRMEALLDPRFLLAEGGPALFGRGRPRYHIAANPSLDGRWLSEHEFRVENGGYYDACIAILDPEHLALYVGEGGQKRIYMQR